MSKCISFPQLRPRGRPPISNNYFQPTRSFALGELPEEVDHRATALKDHHKGLGLGLIPNTESLIGHHHTLV
jgi:hypothetical protein